jgi:GntR family transcriptional regulator/MocR family aminotransferase
MTEFLRDGHFARHIRRMRALYHARRDALLGALREFVPELEPYNADAGLHLTAFLPRGLDDGAIVAAAAERGISASELSTCYAGRHPRHGLILGFGGASERRIRAAAKRLGDLLRAQ